MAGPVQRQSSNEVRAEHEARIEDYINDKLQTHADLEGLDDLLDKVRFQQDLLKQQVRLSAL